MFLHGAPQRTSQGRVADHVGPDRHVVPEHDAHQPLGVCLFVVCSLSRIPIERLIVAVMPFLLCEIAILFLVSYVPIIALLVPRLLGYVQ